MCGFAGFLGREQFSRGEMDHALQMFCRALSHRGPDDLSVWHDPDSGIGLAHRRLAIADLSSAGRQPMLSHCGRYVLAFNGEVYNHTVLREALAQEQGDISWAGHSDTEVLLECL